MRIITIITGLFISGILSGCSEKEKEEVVVPTTSTSSTEGGIVGDAYGGILPGVLKAVGLPAIGGSVPLPMEIVSLERELVGKSNTL